MFGKQAKNRRFSTLIDIGVIEQGVESEFSNNTPSLHPILHDGWSCKMVGSKRIHPNLNLIGGVD
jgi:hypothetical protein